MARKDFIKAKANAFAGLAAVLFAMGLVLVGCDKDAEQLHMDNVSPSLGGLSAEPFVGGVLVKWSPNSIDYTVTRTDDKGSPERKVSVLTSSCSYYIDTSDLVDGTTYTYKFVDVLADYGNVASSSVTASGPVSIPAAGTNIAGDINATLAVTGAKSPNAQEGDYNSIVTITLDNLSPEFSYSLYVAKKASEFAALTDPTFSPSDSASSLSTVKDDDIVAGNVVYRVDNLSASYQYGRVVLEVKPRSGYKLGVKNNSGNTSLTSYYIVKTF